MEQIILAIGVGSIGAIIGLFLGFFMAKRMGLTPSAKELQRALDASEDYYKTMMGRFRGRLKEYEQPSELQRLSSRVEGESQEDMITAFANELPNIRGLPRWVRPFIPAITGWLKENPEQVKALISKFTGSQKKGEDLNTGDAL